MSMAMTVATMKAETDAVLDPVSVLANRLGAALGPRCPWCFIAQDPSTGEVTLFTNQPPERARKIMGDYVKAQKRSAEP